MSNPYWQRRMGRKEKSKHYRCLYLSILRIWTKFAHTSSIFMCELHYHDSLVETSTSCWLCQVGCHIDLGVTGRRMKPLLCQDFWLKCHRWVKTSRRNGRDRRYPKASCIPSWQSVVVTSLCTPWVAPRVTQTQNVTEPEPFSPEVL